MSASPLQSIRAQRARRYHHLGAACPQNNFQFAGVALASSIVLSGRLLVVVLVLLVYIYNTRQYHQRLFLCIRTTAVMGTETVILSKQGKQTRGMQL